MVSQKRRYVTFKKNSDKEIDNTGTINQLPGTTRYWAPMMDQYALQSQIVLNNCLQLTRCSICCCESVVYLLG